LIDCLSSRLGRQQVVYPALQSGAQPEWAFQYQSLIDPERRSRRRAAAVSTNSISHALARPLRFFDPPLPLRRLSVAGDPEAPFASDSAELDSDCVLIAGQGGKGAIAARLLVVRRWGPERIETGWWRGQSTRRDYWRVEIKTGEQFWIYRDLRTGHWFLQGEF
jgi:protein ImuB